MCNSAMGSLRLNRLGIYFKHKYFLLFYYYYNVFTVQLLFCFS